MGDILLNPKFIRAWIVAAGLLVLLFFYPPLGKQEEPEIKPGSTEIAKDINKSAEIVKYTDNSTDNNDRKLIAETKENQIEPWNTDKVIKTREGQVIISYIYDKSDLKDLYKLSVDNFITKLKGFKYKNTNSILDRSPVEVFKTNKGNCSGISLLIAEYLSNNYKSHIDFRLVEAITDNPHMFIEVKRKEEKDYTKIDLVFDKWKSIEDLENILGEVTDE